MLGHMTLTQAIEVAYLAMRVLTFRDGADHMLAGLRRKASIDPAAEAAVGILDATEREYGKPIRDLSDEEAGAKVRALGRALDERTGAEIGGDPLVGRRVLAEMRAGRPLSV